MSYTVQIGFTSATKTYTVLESGFNYTERVGAKGKHVTQSIKVQIHSAEAVGLFLTETKRFIPVTLKNGNTAIFEGVTRPYQNVSASYNREDNFSFEIMDLTEVMNEDLKATNYIKQTVSYIVNDLVSKAGITGKTLDIDATFGARVLPFIGINDGGSIADALANILYEYGYDFRFEVGKIVVFPTTITTTPAQNIVSIRGKLNISRADDLDNGIILNYNKFATLEKPGRFCLANPSTIRFDFANQDVPVLPLHNREGIVYDGIMHIDLAEYSNGNVIGDGSTKDSIPPATKGGIEWDTTNIQILEGEKAVIKVVSVDNVTITGNIEDENGVTSNYHVRNANAKGCEYWISFEGDFDSWFGTGWGWNVKIDADVNYLVSSLANYKVDESSSGTKNTTITGNYVTTSEDASAYAQREYSRQKNANTTYSFSSFVKYDVGNFYNLADSSVTGISTVVRILSVKHNVSTGLYEYTAEGANSINLVVSIEQLAKKDISGAITAGLITTGSTTSLASGETVKVSAQGLLTAIDDNRISYKWYLNGTELTGETGLNVDVDYASLQSGNNTVTVKAFVTDSGTTTQARESSFVVSKKVDYTQAKNYGCLSSAPANANIGDFFLYTGTTTAELTSGQPYVKGVSGWVLMSMTDTDASDKLLSLLESAVATNTQLQPNTVLYTWANNLVAQNAVINNLIAKNLQVGSGSVSSGFMTRIQDNNGSPLFDVYYGGTCVFKIDPSTGNVFFGKPNSNNTAPEAGFMYDAANLRIVSKDNKVIIDSSGTITVSDATIQNNISISGASITSAQFNGQIDCPSFSSLPASGGGTSYSIVPTGTSQNQYNAFTGNSGINGLSRNQYYQCSHSLDSSIKYFSWRTSSSKDQIIFYNSSFYNVGGISVSGTGGSLNPYRYNSTWDNQTYSVTIVASGGDIFKFKTIPTSSSGLETGQVWCDINNSKVLKMV